jgi:hypothetical protein
LCQKLHLTLRQRFARRPQLDGSHSGALGICFNNGIVYRQFTEMGAY